MGKSGIGIWIGSMEMSIMEAKKFLSQPELGLNKQHFLGAIAKYPAPLFPLGGIL